MDTDKPKTFQDKPPNFRDEEGQLFLVRCYACDPKFGKENYAMIVAKGICAWCGWREGEMENV